MVTIDEKFVYVLDKATRDALLKAGYQMIGFNEKKDIFIFVNQDGIGDVLEGHNYFPSNKLTF